MNDTLFDPGHDGLRCLEWRGPTNKGGYGQVKRQGRNVLLHRLVIELAEGPLLPDEVVRHTCDNPPCFRYSHLVRCTQLDNIADMVAKGRGRNQYAGRTECPNGHAYDEANTYWRPDGRGRECRTCVKERNWPR